MPYTLFSGRPWKPGDPLWLPEDREVALAYQTDEDERCPGCGQPRDESFTDDNWHAEAYRCFACKARDVKRNSWDGDKEGLYFVTARDDARGSRG